jgi:predicted phosphodiesterase
MQFWDNEEIEFLSKRLGNPTKEIYDDFCDKFGSNRSYDSIQKKVKKLRDAYAEVDTDDEIDPLPEVQELLEQSSQVLFVPSVTSDKRAIHREEAKAWLQGILDATGDVKLVSKAVPVNSPLSSLVVVLSDTHFGKHTDSFNLSVAKERMLSIPENLAKKDLPEFDEIVVLLVGDMIEGEDIYPTQSHHVEVPAIDQVRLCTEALWELFVRLEQKFDVPVRVETCPGNHGRVSKTANEKTNWDNVIYHLLNVMGTMAKNPKININCNFEEFHRFKVKDRTGLLYHHGVKHTGTPGMRIKIAGWTASKNFDFLVHGHWHEWHVGNWLGKWVIGNGCMCGPDDLAERMAVEDDARQAFFIVTPGQPLWGFSFIEFKTDHNS